MAFPDRIPPIIPPAAVPPVVKAPEPPVPPVLRPATDRAPIRPKGIEKEPLLTLEELERFKNLLIFARSTVEGFFSGKHKSPQRGSSAEFAEFKEYVPGDDVAKIDWRAYGRTRRLYVRQFEEETDMVVYLLLDTSASMSYHGEKRQAKYRLAAKIAAALSYLMIHQGDKTALALFSDKVTNFVAPGGTRRHLHRLISELERVQPASGTGLVQALTECHGIFRKRGRLVVLSDFLSGAEGLFEALGQFLHRKFEILLIQVLDPDELHLPAATVARFVDLESGEQVQVDPDEIRRTYRESMARLVENLAREAHLRQIDYARIGSDQPYLEAIEAYLGFRGETRRWT